MHLKNLNRKVTLLAGTALLISGQYFCSPKPEEKATGSTTEAKAPTADEIVAKGKYLVLVGGCNDCHSPKAMTAMGPMPDTTRLLSGHPAGSKLPEMTYDATKPGNWMLFAPDLTVGVGPWGMSFSANLTPDSTTGLGAWTADNFIQAMRKGKHMGQDGGRPILPPMPWQAVGQWTDEDLKHLFAYLQSIPAIKNEVPAPVPPTELSKMK